MTTYLEQVLAVLASAPHPLSVFEIMEETGHTTREQQHKVRRWFRAALTQARRRKLAKRSLERNPRKGYTMYMYRLEP